MRNIKDILLDEAMSLLESLRSLTNGPPLIREKKEWEEVMQRVDDFLKKWNS